MDAGDLPPEDVRRIEATETSFRILQGLKLQDGAGVTELATELDLPKSTVHKHLTTLRSMNYVVNYGGVYRLSLSFLGLGYAARSHFRLVRIAQDSLKKLADSTDQTASLSLFEHTYCFHVDRVSPSSVAPLPFHQGERLPPYATAGGKAILAYTPESARQQILDRIELDEFTDQTITDQATLEEELQVVYDRRKAYDRGEYVEGVHGIAAPITNEEGHAVGAVTVSIPTDEREAQTIDSDIPTFLGSTAHSIETRLISR